MVFFNWATMQMAAKIVYYGPGLCGKTSNLSYIYAKTAPTSRGEMVSLETESDRTLFFDLLPLEVGTIGGFKTRLQLYTVPGQVFYNTTRKLVLKGVDGVVFVADSQRPMREANLESFASLRQNLEELGLAVEDVPLVLQFNKRDLQNTLTIEELNRDLNPESKYPFHESSAINGNGVFETLKEITKLTLKKLRKRMAAPQPTTPRPRPTATVRPTAPASALRPTTISAAALARAAEEAVEQPEVGPDPAPPAPPPPAPFVVVPVAPQHPEPATREPVAAPAPPRPAEPFPLEPIVTKLRTWAARTAAETVAASLEQLGKEARAAEPAPKAAAKAAAKPEPPPQGGVAPPIEVPKEPEPVLAAPPSAAAEAPVEAPLDKAEAPAVAAAAPAEPAAVEEAEAEEVKVEFDKTDVDVEITPPPIKRVQVSNQMDILAELEELRKTTTGSSPLPSRAKASAATPDLDLDSLIGGGMARQKELRRKLAKGINSDIFKRMRTVQLAIRIQDAAGDTIHTLDPVLLGVDQAGALEKLSLLLTIDLENRR